MEIAGSAARQRIALILCRARPGGGISLRIDVRNESGTEILPPDTPEKRSKPHREAGRIADTMPVPHSKAVSISFQRPSLEQSSDFFDRFEIMKTNFNVNKF